MNFRVSIAPGFTLIELMIVLVIATLLLTIALPTYHSQLRKAGRVTAQSALLQVVARQERYFVLNRQYASTLKLLGYPSGPYAIGPDGEWLEQDSSKRIYLITLSQVDPKDAPRTFTISAIPQQSQSRDSRCGILTINAVGVKTAGEGSVGDCW